MYKVNDILKDLQEAIKKAERDLKAGNDERHIRMAVKNELKTILYEIELQLDKEHKAMLTKIGGNVDA